MLTLSEAVQSLKDGKIIAYPTEAVFGLGCDPHNEEAMNNLLNLKGRDASKGFILIASTIEQILPYIDLTEVNQNQWEKIQKTWPGPYTWIFPCKKEVSRILTGNRSTIAVRVSDHPIVQQLCHSFKGALISTSANLQGEPPIKKQQEILNKFGDDITGVLAGELGKLEKPTAIFDAVTSKQYR